MLLPGLDPFGRFILKGPPRRQGLLQQLDEIDVLVDEVGGYEHFEVGILDHVAEFSGLVAGVDRNGPRPQHRARQQQVDVGRAVREEDTDVVALGNTERSEVASGVDGPSVELGEGDPVPCDHQSKVVGRSVGGASEQITDRVHLGPVGHGGTVEGVPISRQAAVPPPLRAHTPSEATCHSVDRRVAPESAICFAKIGLK